MSQSEAQQDEIVMLTIPCSRRVLPKLLAGMPVFSIRLTDEGDGTHRLIVHGVNGPLSDPFEDLDSPNTDQQLLEIYERALREIVITVQGTGPQRDIARRSLREAEQIKGEET